MIVEEELEKKEEDDDEEEGRVRLWVQQIEIIMQMSTASTEDVVAHLYGSK